MECVLFIGLPASGKSTFFRERFAATHACVSKDAMRSARNRERRQLREVEAHLAAGRSVVIDNTNPRRETRRGTIDVARRAGARVVAYWFDTRVDDCLQRNRERSGEQRVPDVAIFSAAKGFERPELDEGIHQTFRVGLVGTDAFEVTCLESSHEDSGAERSAAFSVAREGTGS